MIENAEDGTYSVPWVITYNPERKVDVEGNVLVDTITSGAVNATVYDEQKPFVVEAYVAGAEDAESDGAPDALFRAFEQEWGNDVVVSKNEAGRTSWTWTVPDKSAHDLDEDTHYTYVVTYYTKVSKDKILSGYVGNKIAESGAGNTRDGKVVMPVQKLTVGKEAAQVEPDYTQWRITFKRPNQNYALSRVAVEDTLPSASFGGNTYVDEFVNVAASEDPEHGYAITGLYEDEGERAEVDYIDGAATFQITFYKQAGDGEDAQGLLEKKDGDDGEITVCMNHDGPGLWDVPAPMMQGFLAAGICPAGLEDMLESGDVVYGK